MVIASEISILIGPNIPVLDLDQAISLSFKASVFITSNIQLVSINTNSVENKVNNIIIKRVEKGNIVLAGKVLTE